MNPKTLELHRRIHAVLSEPQFEEIPTHEALAVISDILVLITDGMPNPEAGRVMVERVISVIFRRRRVS